jgi:hypothetical protein
MAGRWAIGSIASVALTDASDRDMRVDVLDGEGLNSTFAGSSVQALDFSIHTQLSNRSTKGVRFGCHIALLSIAKLNAILAAIAALEATHSTFPVVLADANGSDKADDIDTNCVVDYQSNNGKVYQRGALSNVYVKDVVFRFISVS